MWRGSFRLITSTVGTDGLRACFRTPIPEIFEAARLLDIAASAHINGDAARADDHLRAADMPIIGDWLDSIWLGGNTPIRAIRKVDCLPPVLPKPDRHHPRDAAPATQQHRGFQVMWLQYDHVVVHSRGGETSEENIVVTCPACNFGRDRYMMSEVGLRDPREYPRQPYWNGWQNWDGLERLLPERARFSYQPTTSSGLKK